MSEEKQREHFEAYYSIHLFWLDIRKDVAWEIWKKSSDITEKWLKG